MARHPDIFLQGKGNRRLYLIEMAVAWDSILAERRAKKLSKLMDLRADLRREYPGYRRLDTAVPVVIGGAGYGHTLIGE